jgi:hypothetical protein
MSASHTYNNSNNNDSSDGMDVSTEWNGETTHGVEEDVGADTDYAGYSMAHDNGDYLDDYDRNTMDGPVNSYDNNRYSYQLANGAAAQTGKDESAFGTNRGVTFQKDNNAASFSHEDEYLEDYIPNQEEYPDHQDNQNQENDETQGVLNAQETHYYQNAVADNEGDDDDDEVEEGLHTDRQATIEADLTDENPIVQEIRANIDETHAKMRFWTNKLLQEMEVYVKTLVETEKTYSIIQQQELAESERLDRCEADVTRAIAAFNFQSSQDEDEEVYPDDTVNFHNAPNDFQNTETD